MTNPPYGAGDGDTPDLNSNPQPPTYGGTAGDGYGYGAPPPAYGAAGYGPKPKGLAIASMVCGIVSIVLCFIPYLTLPTGIAAVVTGVMANKKIKLGEAGGDGMAKAGLITGIIGIVLAVVIFILGVIGITMQANDLN